MKSRCKCSFVVRRYALPGRRTSHTGSRTNASYAHGRTQMRDDYDIASVWSSLNDADRTETEGPGPGKLGVKRSREGEEGLLLNREYTTRFRPVQMTVLSDWYALAPIENVDRS